MADLRSNDASVQYLHTDHLGSPVAATDNGGIAVDTHSYYPFGEIRTSSTAFDTERGFTGQIADTATGLNFYNARYMDPVLGRFVSPDIIVPDRFNPAHRNRFTYVSNNPLRFTDPTGHVECEDDPSAPGCPGSNSSTNSTGTFTTSGICSTFHVNDGGDVIKTTYTPVIIVNNPMKSDGRRLFNTKDAVVVVPYVGLDDGCDGFTHCIVQPFNPDTSHTPWGQRVNIQRKHNGRPEVIAEELYHHFDQGSGLREAAYMLAYVAAAVPRGAVEVVAGGVGADFNAHGGHPLEVSGIQAGRLAVLPTHVVYSLEAGVAPPMPPCGRV